MKGQFSTGIQALDEYIGYLQATDSFLTFYSSKKQWEMVFQHIVHDLSLLEYPLIYLSVSAEYSSLFENIKKKKGYTLEGKRNSVASLSKNVRKFLLSLKKNSFVFLDDLSAWKLLVGNEKHVSELYTNLTELAADKNLILFASALRSEFTPRTLALFKDASTVVFDVWQKEESLCFVPLLLKNRYNALHTVPLRINVKTFSCSKVKDSEQAGISPLGMAEEIYQKFFLESSEPMMLFERGTDLWEVNKPLAELLGCSIEETKLRPPLSFVVPEDKIKGLRFLSALQRRKRASVVLKVKNKSGRTFPVEVSVSNVGGKKFAAVVKDRSPLDSLKHKIETIETDFQSLLENSPSPMLVVQNNKVVYANSSLRQLLGGVSADVLFAKKVKEYFSPSSSKLVSQILQGSDAPSQPLEVQVYKNDGSLVECTLSISSISFQSKPSKLFSFTDVTKRNEIIRELTASEERYRQIVAQNSDAMCLLQEGKIVVANAAFLRLFDLESLEELTERDFTQFVDEREKEAVKHFFKKVEMGKSASRAMEFTASKKDGKTLEIEMTVSLVHSSRGKECVVLCRDISELKRQFNELKSQVEEVRRVETIVAKIRSNDVRKILHQSLHEMMMLHQWEFGVSYLLNRKTRELELQKETSVPEVLSQKLATLAPDHGIGGLLSKTGESYFYPLSKYPSYLPHRSVFEKAGFGSVGFIPLISGEECVGVLLVGTKAKSVFLPFTKQFYSLLSLRLGSIVGSLFTLSHVQELEEQFQTLSEVNSSITYRMAPSGSLLYVSKAVEQLLGYQPKEFYRNPSLWLSLVHPDDKKLLLDRTANLSRRGTRITLEYRIRPKGKASYCWVKDELNIVEKSGEEMSLYGFVYDISDTKIIVENLYKENAFQTNLISSISEGIVVFDVHLRCRLWNQTLTNFTGITFEQAVGKHVTELFLPEENEERLSLVRKALEGNEMVSGDLLLKIQKKQRLIMWEHYSPLRNTAGEVEGVVGIMRNVTSEKQFEQKLRDSEDLLTNLIDTMDDILIVTDLKGTILQVNRAFLNTLGYKRNQVIGMEFPYPWLLEEEMGRYVLWISSLREKSSLHDFDMTWKAKDNRLYSFSMSTTLLRNAVGEPFALLNLARDITERKRLTKKLEERNKQVELINRINAIANQTVDFSEVFSAFSEEISTVLSYDDLNFGLLDEQKGVLTIYAGEGISGSYVGREFPLEKAVSKSAVSSRRPVLVRDFQEHDEYRSLASYEEGLRSQISIPLIVKERVLGTLNIGSKTPHRYNDDDVEFLSAVAQQMGGIFDRVLLFKKVTDDATYIHNLLDSIDNIVYTVDAHCRILEVNKAWREFVRNCGVTELPEYHSMNLYDALPDEPLKIMLQNVVDDMLNGTVRFFSQEYVFERGSQRQVYQVTINPMVSDHLIAGLVITHTDITPLKQTELELKKYNEQLLVLYEISTLMRSSFDFNEVLSLTLPLLKKNIEASAILVYRLDEQENVLLLVKHIGFDHVPPSQIDSLRVHDSAMGMVVKRKEALFINEAAYKDERILRRELLKQESIEALAIIPLLAKNTVLGTLCVLYTQPKTLTPLLQNILSLVGNQLGIALDNTRLYGELQSQVSRLTVLYELSERLTSTLEVDTICRLVLQNTLRVVPYRRAVLSLCDKKQENFDVVFSAEITPQGRWEVSKYSQPTTISLGSIEQLTIKRRSSAMSDTQTSMYVPMLSKESILGLLCLESTEQERYTSVHLRVIESISNLTALALEKGKLYEETIQKSLEIERRNKELDDFTYVVSHDLKEPLISVEGFSKILLADYGEIIQDEGKEYLNSMVGATTRMKKLIDDLLMLSRVGRLTESFKPIALTHLLQKIKREMEFILTGKNINIIIQENLPTVYGSETHLKILFNNLISNAVKFNNSPVPTVQIGLQNTENNTYLFYVKDNGIGIEKEFYEKIFMIFQRLHRREEYEGTGAGLTIVKKIIELHKGNIWVESEAGKGSTFYFTLPKHHTFMER